MGSPNVSSASNRAYQTDYEAHVGLMRKLVHSISKRAFACGVAYEFEDAMQDAAVVYVKAARGYDPSRGVTFTAYLGRAIHNELNVIVDKMIAMRTEVIPMNVEDMGDSMHDILESDECEGIEDRAIRFEEIREKVQTLSPLARLFVREFNNPSKEMRNKLNAMIENAKKRKAAGERWVRMPEFITLSMVAEHYNVNNYKLYGVRREFKEKLGVDF